MKQNTKHFVSDRTLPETYGRECGMGPLNETVKPTVLQSYIEVKPINSSFIAKGNKQTPARLLSSPTHCLSHFIVTTNFNLSELRK